MEGITAHDVSQQAPVSNLLEKATGRLDSLHQSISMLEKRLESVLRPQSPETAMAPELHDTQPDRKSVV